ncbi:alpha/beta fold hydrolase [Mycobacterium liflandii]|uniref:alpha/beta fold hydrolase n=1 Tax=Mycobacterium liflandii TaxID=261524 RepID=UPI00298A081C|nr:alpha/beta fold hydrolase [Mycobacterium liflandii]
MTCSTTSLGHGSKPFQRLPTWLGMVSDFLMATDKTGLVLLHGGAGSGRAWQDVVPVVSRYHQVHAPTAPGHRGGPPVQRRPATAADERYLDEQGLQRPHLVGHSMGGIWRSNWLGAAAQQQCVCLRQVASGRRVTGCEKGRCHERWEAPESLA